MLRRSRRRVASATLPAIAAPFALVLALAYGGCTSDGGDESGPSPDAGSEATPLADAGAPDSQAPQGCEADRADDGMWRHLRCAGLYEDFDAKRLAPELRAYKPALELWSDGAEKQRWISIPAGAKIDTSNIDEWIFPNGTRAWKEFRLDGKRVETRLYEKGDDGQWRHAAFRWSDDESDAVRTDAGEKIARGGAGAPPYEIPSATECNDCHGGRTDKLLGFEAVNAGLAGAEGLTLAMLASLDLLTAPPPSTTLALPEDATGNAAAALGWMHVSCGPCHNRSSAANGENSRVYTLTHASELLARDGGPPATVDMLDAYTSTVGRPTTFEIPDGGGATFSVIKAGAPTASLASYLSGRRVAPDAKPNEKEQMPPIVTRLVDAKGHALLDTWIGSLPP